MRVLLERAGHLAPQDFEARCGRLLQQRRQRRCGAADRTSPPGSRTPRPPPACVLFHLLPTPLQARTLLNILCAAGAAGATASQVLGRGVAVAALACCRRAGRRHLATANLCLPPPPSSRLPLQSVMDRLCLVALAVLPELPPAQLGSLAWSIGKLGSRLGASRIHTPARRLLAAAAGPAPRPGWRCAWRAPRAAVTPAVRPPALTLPPPAAPSPARAQVLHAVTAKAWRHLGEIDANVASNLLYGFGLLSFHPGGCGPSARPP